MRSIPAWTIQRQQRLTSVDVRCCAVPCNNNRFTDETERRRRRRLFLLRFCR